MEDLLASLLRYALMAYSAQTVAEIGERLVPVPLKPQARRDLREWLSTGFGLLLAIASGADILAELGLVLSPPIIGVAITGLIVGQGGRFLNRWISSLPSQSGSRTKKG